VRKYQSWLDLFPFFAHSASRQSCFPFILLFRRENIIFFRFLFENSFQRYRRENACDIGAHLTYKSLKSDSTWNPLIGRRRKNADEFRKTNAVHVIGHSYVYIVLKDEYMTAWLFARMFIRSKSLLCHFQEKRNRKRRDSDTFITPR